MLLIPLFHYHALGAFRSSFSLQVCIYIYSLEEGTPTWRIPVLCLRNCRTLAQNPALKHGGTPVCFEFVFYEFVQLLQNFIDLYYVFLVNVAQFWDDFAWFGTILWCTWLRFCTVWGPRGSIWGHLRLWGSRGYQVGEMSLLRDSLMGHIWGWFLDALGTHGQHFPKNSVGRYRGSTFIALRINRITFRVPHDVCFI